MLANLDIDKDNKIANRHVVKSLSSIRSIAVEYESNKHLFKGANHNEPVLFQELIEGDNIRVHVVEDECFPIKILAKKLDYRYDEGPNRSFHTCNIPNNIVEECLKIAKKHKLRFCGIDLIHNY